MRNDLIVFQPEPLTFGLAGSTVLDKNFNCKITRATDPSTHKGFSLMTADAALANLWNKDSSMLIITTTGGEKLILDTKTFQPTSFTYSGPLCWSRVNRSVLYGISGLQIIKFTFKKILGFWSYTSKAVITDFTKVLPPAFMPAWYSAFLVSDKDQAFAFGVSEGIQDTGFYACSYNNGKQTVLNTNGQANPFLIHEVYQTHNPDYVIINPTGKSVAIPVGPCIWDLTLNAVTFTNTTGHFAFGTATFVCGGPGGGQWASLPFDSPTDKVMVVNKNSLPAAAGQVFREDAHASWNNAVTDLEPFYVSTGGPTFGQALPYSVAWYNEILAYNHNGTVSRICQTHNTCKSPYFITQNAIAVICQNGKKIAFASDWMGTLGTDIFGRPRGDVFIIEL